MPNTLHQALIKIIPIGPKTVQNCGLSHTTKHNSKQSNTYYSKTQRAVFGNVICNALYDVPVLQYKLDKNSFATLWYGTVFLYQMYCFGSQILSTHTVQSTGMQRVRLSIN